MPKYEKKIPVPGKSAEELFLKVSEDIERFLSKGVPGELKVERDESTKVVSVSHTLFSAELTCEHSVLVLDAKLSLMALPFRSKLDEAIEKWVNKNFPKA